MTINSNTQSKLSFTLLKVVNCHYISEECIVVSSQTIRIFFERKFSGSFRNEHGKEVEKVEKENYRLHYRHKVYRLT